MEVSDSRLKYLYEAHRRGTMRAASEHFDVDPSSVSRQIAGLERELGLLLVEKGRHTVTLTEAGRLLVDYYQERSGRYDALKSALDDVRGMRTGHVRVGVGQSLINALLARVVHAYRQEWPGIRVHVMEVPSQQVLSLLMHDEVHFGLLLDPPPDPQLRDRFHFAQPLQLVVPYNHPLAQRDSVALRDLLAYPLVLPTSNFRSRQLLEEIAVREGFQLDPVMTVSSIHMLVNCIRAGIGIGLTADIYLAHEPGTDHLVSIPIDNEVLSSFSVHAMTRQGRVLPRSAQVLLSMLERAIRSERRQLAAC
jgi:DNA-binding transcriptional LysR family regulator